MSYGLKIRNKNTETQIDYALGNYVYAQGGDSVASIQSTYNFTNNTTYPPIVLIRPTVDGSFASLFSFAYTAPNYTSVTIYAGDTGGAAQSYKWRLFVHKATLANATKQETYGMRIRDNQGALVYDNWDSPFKIVDKASFTMATNVPPTTDSSTYTHASYSEPWYILSPRFNGLYRQNLGGGFIGESFLSVAIHRLSATSVTARWYNMHNGVVPGTGSNTFSFQGTAVDILICTVPDSIQTNA